MPKEKKGREMLDAIFDEASRRNADGTLTVGTAIHFGFYRLLEGEHAGKVVIKSTAKVDGEPILYFANAMTQISASKLKDVRCEMTRPTFPSSIHEIDRSKAGWYTDSGEYQCHEW